MTNPQNAIKRERILNIRECLRQVQKLLPRTTNAGEGEQFICIQVNNTTCSELTKDDTRAWIEKALDGSFTFNGWMACNNPDQEFTGRRLMALRQQWINQLCRSLTIQANKL